MNKSCALMGCKLEGNELSLGVCLKKLPATSQGRTQALELIKKHGFKDADILCENCFWK